MFLTGFLTRSRGAGGARRNLEPGGRPADFVLHPGRVRGDPTRGNPAAGARERLAKARKQGKLRRGALAPGAETAEEEGWDGFAWKHNALRHSLISYRVAAIQDVNQAALEAGNSPQMIFRHYRELVRPTDAKAWFGIEPKAAENVTVMPKLEKAV